MQRKGFSDWAGERKAPWKKENLHRKIIPDCERSPQRTKRRKRGNTDKWGNISYRFHYLGEKKKITF